MPPEEIRRRVDESLKAVGMYEYREHSPHQLSGGQKQRVAIAGIIAMRPKCIVLDEPTAMLDPQGRREVLRTIRELGNQFGITVVLITHYMDEAAQCDRVVVMDNGKIILDGVPRAVFSHVEQLKNVGLDVPQVTELAWLLLQDDYCLPDDIIFEEECVRPLKNCWRNAMSVIKTEHLTHTYSQGTSYEQAAVSDVTLEIEPGEMIGVIGHTGSGKSTLIQHFNGLLRPTSGKILVDGEDIWENPKKKSAVSGLR